VTVGNVTGALSVTTGAADDTINLNGTLGTSISLTPGAGGNTLSIDRAFELVSRTVTLTGAQITGLELPIALAAFPFVNLTLGAGNDTLSLQNLNSLLTVSASGGGGADIVSVKSSGAALASTRVLGGGGNDTLKLDFTPGTVGARRSS